MNINTQAHRMMAEEMGMTWEDYQDMCHKQEQQLVEDAKQAPELSADELKEFGF